MDKFLERYSLPKLSQEESENLNSQITTNDIEAIIRKLVTNKSPGPGGFTREFHQTLKELTHILLILFQKTQEGGKLQGHFTRSALS